MIEINPKNSFFLEEMLYEAIYIPQNQKPLPKEIVFNPELYKYIQNWGRDGDLGFITLQYKEMVGAIWVRFFSQKNKGYGYISEEIPELCMAVKKEYQSQGIGSKLMKKMIEELKNRKVEGISISVDKRNRAFNFYKRMGFYIVSQNKDDYLMKIDLI